MKSVGCYIPSVEGEGWTEDLAEMRAALNEYSDDVVSTDIARIERSINSLSDDDREWLERVQQKLGIHKTIAEGIRDGLRVNQAFLSKLADMVTSVGESKAAAVGTGSPMSARVRLLPWAVARDWTSEGMKEHQPEFSRVIPEIESMRTKSGEVRVLVPGSGCGRLAYELTKLGCTVHAVEFDTLKLLAMDYVLQSGLATTPHPTPFPLQPFLLETCNRIHHGDNTRTLTVPDCSIESEVLQRIHIDANEFLHTQLSPNSMDAVVTSFFLDTTNHVDDYIRVMANTLRVGGKWVNFGPLGYHYNAEKSIRSHQPFTRELNLEQLKQRIEAHGFKIETEEMVESTYLGNERSMMSTVSTCWYFVATIVK